MSNEKPGDRILSKVDDRRRDFVKRVLVGAGFAAPVIASFSIGSLSVDAALAQDQSHLRVHADAVVVSSGPACSVSSVGPHLPDLGYVGPGNFQAYVYDVSGSTRVNGEVSINVHGDRTAGIDIDMNKDAVVTSAYLFINGVSVATLPIQGNPNISISNLCNLPDFDALLQAMALQRVTAVVNGSYYGTAYSAQGPVIPASSGGIVQLNP